MVHHKDMESTTSPSAIKSVCFALASLGLGAFLASGVDHLVLQAVMLSFPPASLMVALRREKLASVIEESADTYIQTPSFEEITAGLNLDILSRAS